jgi:hypothetical protein
MPRRIARFTAGAALQLVALVLAHQLVYLARYGSLYGEALVHSGHGDAWSTAVAISAILGLGLAIAAAFRLRRLGVLARGRDESAETTSAGLDIRWFVRSYLRIAPRLAGLLVVMLTIQENAERALVGQAMPGAGVLMSPEYAGGLWIAIAVGLTVALVAALFQWRQRVLLGRLRTTRPARRAAPGPSPRPAILERPVESLLGRRSALRAPPTRAAI